MHDAVALRRGRAVAAAAPLGSVPLPLLLPKRLTEKELKRIIVSHSPLTRQEIDKLDPDDVAKRVGQYECTTPQQFQPRRGLIASKKARKAAPPPRPQPRPIGWG